MSNSESESGFTLLEVMVSVAIIAIVFVSLLRLHGQSISMNETSRFYATAPFLAQEKMAEIKADSSAFSGSQSGTFGGDVPGTYTWETHVDEFPVTTPDGGTLTLLSASVTVRQEETGLKLTIKDYLSDARKTPEQQ